MNDTTSLLVVLALLYLSECFVWIPRGSVALAGPSGGTWHVLKPWTFLGNDRGALAWIPPWCRVVVARTPLWSLSPEGVCAFPSAALDIEGRGPSSGAAWRFDEISLIAREFNEIRINGRLAISGPSDIAAAQYERTLKELLPLKPAARETRIAAAWDHRMNADAARASVKTALDAARPVEISGGVLWALCFVIGPLASLKFGFLRIWIPLAAAGLAAHLTILTLFFFKHCQLRPSDRSERILSLLKKILCPPMAIRAGDALTIPALEEFHPAAAIRALCPAGEYRAFCAAAYRDAVFPLPWGELTAPAQSIVKESHAAYRNAFERHLKAAGESPASWLAPDRPESGEAKAYCPRCHAQFNELGCECHACFGLSVLPLPPPESTRTEISS